MVIDRLFANKPATDESLPASRLAHSEKTLFDADTSIRRALLLALGEYDAGMLTAADRLALVPRLTQLYTDDVDAGIHGECEWLLRHWGHGAEVEKINETLGSNEPRDSWRWYRNRKRHVFTVIKMPAEPSVRRPATGNVDHGVSSTRFTSFSTADGIAPPGQVRKTAAALDTPATAIRAIDYRFAIGTKEVTQAEFERCRKPSESFGLANTPVTVTWYEAACYCNWLSKREGIDKSQWCYEPNPNGIYAKGMKQADNHLLRIGYRLPTSAEWERASRAGSQTAFSFGGNEQFGRYYAWYDLSTRLARSGVGDLSANAGLDDRFIDVLERMLHSQASKQEVGRLKPNDFGMFDMHGNVLEWCDDLVLANYSENGVRQEAYNATVRGGEANANLWPNSLTRETWLDGRNSFRVARTCP